MSQRPINFYGIVTLDHSIIEQLDHYLQERETRLAHQILNSIHSQAADFSSPALPTEDVSLKLSEAVEGLTKKIRSLNKEELNVTKDSVESLVTEINTALWDFTEVLKGSVTELFQQVKQVHIDRWHLSLAEVIHTLEDILVHRIEEVFWIVRRLEKPIKEYQKKVGNSGDWKSWMNIQSSQLDPNLIVTLSQTEKFLKSQYENFLNQYNEYVRLTQRVEEILEKMKNYPILALMEMKDQNLYVDVFRLLKLWELNPRPKSSLRVETIRSLKSLSSIDQVIAIFRNYYRELDDVLFLSSLELKAGEEEDIEARQGRVQNVKQKVLNYRTELQDLMKTMAKYREFLLQTNENPYLRSRWGFTEWIVAQEPLKPKKLLNLIYAAEELDKWYARFIDSLNRPILTIEQQRDRQHITEIDHLLHEMGQPLISRAMMRNRAEHLLELIQESDEVGSLEIETVNFVENVLSKAMRADWKYLLKYGSPLPMKDANDQCVPV